MNQRRLDERIERLEKRVSLITKSVQDLLRDWADDQVARQASQETVRSNADSITIGAPAKGQIKVYGDMDKPSGLERKVRLAQELVKKARKNSEEGSV